MKFSALALSLLALMMSPGLALAQESGLPNGATSLDEMHQDWRVGCGKQPPDAPLSCAVSQRQFNQQTKRAVLTLALTPKAGGGIEGTLLMPFGLALQTGLTMQVDEGGVSEPFPYRTCLPSGCLVTINWPEGTVATLKNAKTINIVAKADGGEEAKFTISLAGFSSALDRAKGLLGV